MIWIRTENCCLTPRGKWPDATRMLQVLTYSEGTPQQSWSPTHRDGRGVLAARVVSQPDDLRTKKHRWIGRGRRVPDRLSGRTASDCTPFHQLPYRSVTVLLRSSVAVSALLYRLAPLAGIRKTWELMQSRANSDYREVGVVALDDKLLLSPTIEYCMRLERLSLCAVSCGLGAAEVDMLSLFSRIASEAGWVCQQAMGLTTRR